MTYRVARIAIVPDEHVPGRLLLDLVLDPDEAAPSAFRLADLDAPRGPDWPGPANVHDVSERTADSIVEEYLGSPPIP